MAEEKPQIILANRHNDCFLCRMVSGAGLIGIGAYVYHHGKARSGNQRTAMFVISGAACLYGVGRLVNF